MAIALCILFLLADARAEAPRARWYDTPTPDRSDWSAKRKASYAKSLAAGLGEPRAVLTIPALDVDVPVFGDHVPLALERGTSWVTGTAEPGGTGNIAIAGHRDGFFRPLEGIPVGTDILLTTGNGSQRFQVTQISIVDPLDTSPLDPEDNAVLTLITCHPFRFQGFAPDRYIVRAELIKQDEEISVEGG